MGKRGCYWGEERSVVGNLKPKNERGGTGNKNNRGNEEHLAKGGYITGQNPIFEKPRGIEGWMIRRWWIFGLKKKTGDWLRRNKKSFTRANWKREKKSKARRKRTQKTGRQTQGGGIGKNQTKPVAKGPGACGENDVYSVNSTRGEGEGTKERSVDRDWLPGGKKEKFRTNGYRRKVGGWGKRDDWDETSNHIQNNPWDKSGGDGQVDS